MKVGTAVTYDFTVEDDKGTKMTSDLPSEVTDPGMTAAKAELTSGAVTKAQYDSWVAMLTSTKVTATKGGAFTMETMLGVVLGLAIVWMLMNYKK